MNLMDVDDIKSVAGRLDPLNQALSQSIRNVARNWLNSTLSSIPSVSSGVGSRRRARSSRSSTTTGRSRRRLGTSTVVNVDGTSTGTGKFKKKKKRRTKKKTSTRKLLSSLKKNLPKVSRKHYINYVTYFMSANVPNIRKIYEYDCKSAAAIDNHIKTLTACDSAANVDYTGSNTAVKYTWYWKLHIKNNATGNAFVRFAFYRCQDDDQEAVIDDMKEYVIDRGYSGTITRVNTTAAGATFSKQEKHLTLGDDGPFHMPSFSAHHSKKWKQLGKVQTASIGPGDTFDVIKSGKGIYKPEDLDNDGFSYKIGDVHCIIDIRGELGHDDTNNNLVGYSPWHFDAEEQSKYTFVYSNPKGLNEVVYTDTITDTNFSSPVFADNVQSVVQQAQA